MIGVARGLEPEALRKLRLEEIPRLERLSRTRPLTGDDIKGYRIVAGDLWRAHLRKCCYCENHILLLYNDVEHHRPKASAERGPGCKEKHGYWWLAFTWTNLLFACPSCNRTGKNDLFPLAVGSVALAPHEQPPGKEKPLLLDPAVENGVEHIEFVFSVAVPRRLAAAAPVGWPARKHWWPRARLGSKKGDWTIRVCELDSGEHVELYDNHVNRVVDGAARDLNDAIQRKGDVQGAFDRALRLIQPSMPYVGLSYDALRSLVKNADLAPWKLAWPAPRDVGRPHSARRRR